MLDIRVLDFFKKHNLYDDDIFKFISNNTIYINYNTIKDRCFIGTYWSVDKNNKLSRIKVVIPSVIDDVTLLINIHEIVHAIELYGYIGKKYVEPIYVEVLPIFYEKLYIKENPSIGLEKYNEYVDERIIESEKLKYLIGLRLQDKLFENYNNQNLDKFYLVVKKLVKKYDL